MTDTPTFRVELMGQFRVFDAEDTAVVIRLRKANALFACLAFEPGRRLPRTRLADMFWGHTGEDRARHNLRQCLSSLRKDLGDTDGVVVVSDGDALYVSADAVDVDVQRLRDGVDCEALDELEHALSAYEGEFLADLTVSEDPFAEWKFRQSQSLERAAIAVAEKIVEVCEAGECDRATAALHKVLARDPANERAHRLIMRVLAESGRTSEALRQFERCREALDVHLGVTPSEATVELHDQLRRKSERPAPRHGHEPDDAARARLPLPQQPSLVVLPFRMLGSNTDDIYFGDGIAEDLTVALGRFDSLFVISQTTGLAYRDDPVDPRRVGRELGVHYVVEGSVRRAGQRLRLTVSLTDAGSGRQVWASRFDRELEDVFAVQDEVVRTIVATLVGRIEADRLQRTHDAPTESLAAYDCLLRGKHHHHRYSYEDNLRAASWIEKAIEHDPRYAAAHAWMACVLAQRNTFEPDPSLFDDAYRHVQTAVKIDDGESECHRILAAYNLLRRRFDDAEHHQARALELNPNDDRIVCQQGELLMYRGRPEDALEWIRRAQRLNPYHDDSVRCTLAHALFDAGETHDALAVARRLSGQRPVHHAVAAVCAAVVERPALCREHIAALERARPISDAASFARRLPYERTEDAQRFADALTRAGELAQGREGPDGS